MPTNLPKIEQPVFETKLPSSGDTVKYVPMTSKSQKILLVAKEGRDAKEILGAVKQIVLNCLVAAAGTKLTMFDIDWLFVKIQSVSISNIVKLSFRDVEDEKVRDFDVDLNKVTVKHPESPVDNIIKVNDKVSIKLHYPYSDLYDDGQFLDTVGEKIFDILLPKCVESVNWGTGNVQNSKPPEKELKEWLDNLPVAAYEECKKFLSNPPVLNYEIKYTNDKGNERTITLATLNDFFTLLSIR